MFSKLDSKIKKLLFSHGIFLMGRSAVEIFMSIFIWRLTNDISIVAVFNIIYIFAHTGIFVVFADAFRKGRSHRVRKIGLIGFGLLYLSLFLFQGNVRSFIYAYAFFIGVFNGMYWLPYHINRFNFTDVKNRGSYTGLERAVKTVVKFVAPVAGGYIISSNHFFSGYPALFLIGMVFFVIAFFAGDVEVSGKNNLKKINWKQVTKNVFSNSKIIKSFIAVGLGGFSLNGSLIVVVLPLLILAKTGTEFELGGWLSLFALLSILTSVVLGHFIDYLHYDRSIVVGGSLFIALFLLLYFFPVFWVFVLFGAVQEIAANMMNIPRRVYSENLLSSLPKFEENKVGYMVLREMFGVGLGMTGSYLLLLFVNDFSSQELATYAVLIVAGVLGQMWVLRGLWRND